MKRTLLALSLLLTVACGALPPPPSPSVPPAPTVRTVAMVAVSQGRPVAGAICQLDDRIPHAGTTNADGYVAWNEVPLSLGATQVTCDAPGFAHFSEHRELHPDGNEDLSPAELVSTAPNAGEAGRVHVDGLVFRREDGSIFPWRGATDFLLFKRFLDGEDIDPVLTQRIDAGANVVRVLGMVDSFAHLWPQEYAVYYVDLGRFLDRVAARGLRVEFVAFADAQIIMPAADAEWAHLAHVADVLAGHWNVFLETTNEPFKNIPGGDATAAALCRTVQGRGVLVSSGAYTDWPPLRPCDYGTTHSDRKDEWPRTAKDILDLRDAAPGPWVSDEPTGFAEVADGARRSASADDAAAFAATAALMGAGSTFHSDAGVVSQPWGPVQLAAARAWFDGARWVPVEAQLWPYQRGGDAGTSGVGNMPLEHDDQLALRTFCKGDGSVEYCVAIRPTAAWRAIARDGWRIVEEPRRGFVRLVRP